MKFLLELIVLLPGLIVVEGMFSFGTPPRRAWT